MLFNTKGLKIERETEIDSFSRSHKDTEKSRIALALLPHSYFDLAKLPKVSAE
jgi:hypothetical protein